MSKILIVDDNDDFREVVEELLVDAGYEVLSAPGPDEAREKLSKENIDLIICDLVMPADLEDDLEDEDKDSAMVGVHAIHEFSKKYPNTPIIAVSGQMDGASLQAIQNFGAFETLPKPFQRDQLLKVVERSLR